MLMLTHLALVVTGVLSGEIDGIEQGPEPEDVKAGWGAFAIFLLLCLAVAFLGWSLVRQLRKAQAAKDAGVYGDEPVVRAVSDDPEDDREDDRGGVRREDQAPSGRPEPPRD